MFKNNALVTLCIIATITQTCIGGNLCSKGKSFKPNKKTNQNKSNHLPKKDGFLEKILKLSDEYAKIRTQQKNTSPTEYKKVLKSHLNNEDNFIQEKKESINSLDEKYEKIVATACKKHELNPKVAEFVMDAPFARLTGIPKQFRTISRTKKKFEIVSNTNLLEKAIKEMKQEQNPDTFGITTLSNAIKTLNEQYQELNTF